MRQVKNQLPEIFLSLDHALSSFFRGETPYIRSKVALAKRLLETSDGKNVPIKDLAKDVVARLVNDATEEIHDSSQ